MPIAVPLRVSSEPCYQPLRRACHTRRYGLRDEARVIAPSSEADKSARSPAGIPLLDAGRQPRCGHCDVSNNTGNLDKGLTG